MLYFPSVISFGITFCLWHITAVFVINSHPWSCMLRREFTGTTRVTLSSVWSTAFCSIFSTPISECSGLGYSLALCICLYVCFLCPTSNDLLEFPDLLIVDYLLFPFLKIELSYLFRIWFFLSVSKGKTKKHWEVFLIILLCSLSISRVSKSHPPSKHVPQILHSYQPQYPFRTRFPCDHTEGLSMFLIQWRYILPFIGGANPWPDSFVVSRLLIAVGFNFHIQGSLGFNVYI